MSTDPGWYPSPDDPARLRWWDGQAWTAHSAEAAPAASPGYPAPPMPPPGPSARPKRRRAWPFVVGGAALVLVLVAVSAFVLLGDDPLTFGGREIEEPEQALAAGEDTVDGIVEVRNGASNDETRCYFSLSGDETADVNGFMRCGPVLFVDGDPDAAYLSLPFEAVGDEGDSVRLAVAGEPDDPEPSEIDRGESLRRPDGLEPPDGNGGLEVPPPPPAEPGLFGVRSLDGVDLDGTGPDATIVSFSRTYALSGLAQPDRFGQGDEARTPAEGETFVAAEIAVTPGGDGVAADLPTVEIQIGDEAPRPAPDAVQAEIGTFGMLVSVPEATEVVDLIVTELGVQQRLSLLTGEPAAENVSVLRRTNRGQVLSASQPLTFTASAPGFVTETFTVTPTIEAADLFWFFGSGGTTHPADPNRAFLVIDVSYVWPPPFEPDTGLEEFFWTLTLPDGTAVGAVNVADDPANFIVIAFEVPSAFTDGTITIGGSHTFPDNTTFDFAGNQLTAAVSIPPG